VTDLPVFAAGRGLLLPDGWTTYQVTEACADGVAGCVVRHGPPPPALVASGGWCGPATGVYDLYGLRSTPGVLPDRPWARDVDVDRWLFPRLASVAARGHDYCRRLEACRGFLRLARTALRRPLHDDQEDDPWLGSD
jgi:hypothetical protein